MTLVEGIWDLGLERVLQHKWSGMKKPNNGSGVSEARRGNNSKDFLHSYQLTGVSKCLGYVQKLHPHNFVPYMHAVRDKWIPEVKSGRQTFHIQRTAR